VSNLLIIRNTCSLIRHPELTAGCNWTRTFAPIRPPTAAELVAEFLSAERLRLDNLNLKIMRSTRAFKRHLKTYLYSSVYGAS